MYTVKRLSLSASFGARRMTFGLTAITEDDELSRAGFANPVYSAIA